MRKLIVQEWLSLDGFVSDQDGKMDFFTSISGELNKAADEDMLKLMEDIDTIILGRETYEIFVDYWPAATTEQEPVADKLNGMNKIVFSNTIQDAPWGKWPEGIVNKADAASEIRQMKSSAGKNIIIWGSISLVQSLMRQGLVDEYHLMICPVAIGGGRNFFPANAPHLTLTLSALKKYDTGIVALQYKPAS